MFQFSYKVKIAERVKAKCERHPRYNPERDRRGGITGGCTTCFSLYDLHRHAHARLCTLGLPEKGGPMDTSHQAPEQDP